MPKGAASIAHAVDALIRTRVPSPGARPDVLVGLVGRGIQLSRSPAMHEREAGRMGLACTYLLLDFDALGFSDADLGAVIDAAVSLGFNGLNVTYPFKQGVMPLLDEVTADADAIGAVNTVVFGDRRAGHNTDCWGYAQSFLASMPAAPLGHVVLVGAGGAGSAVGHALIGLGARRISIVDPDLARAEALAGRLAGTTASVVGPADLADVVKNADGIVNTTPVGMAKHPGSPIDTALLSPGQWVSDVIYFPQETELLRQARRLGCRTLPGIGMAIGQAARAFELFTGRAADMTQMAGHFEAAA
jgi:shikimate dehydrogenase